MILETLRTLQARELALAGLKLLSKRAAEALQRPPISPGTSPKRFDVFAIVGADRAQGASRIQSSPTTNAKIARNDRHTVKNTELGHHRPRTGSYY